MRLFNVCGTSPLGEVAVAVEQLAGEHPKDKGIYPNVDFYSGIIYDKMGIEVDLFTPLFAMARVSGWLAHWWSSWGEQTVPAGPDLPRRAQPALRPNRPAVGQRDLLVRPINHQTTTDATNMIPPSNA